VIVGDQLPVETIEGIMDLPVSHLICNETGECNGVGHASRSSGLLRVEVSQTRVSQSDIKTGGDAMAGGARDTIADVTLESC
jgi:hypothetical protein